MGSEFSYADVTPPPVEDFHNKLLGTETIDGVECWKIQSIPKDDDIADENGYSKRIGFFAKQDFVIRKAIFWDLDEELYKELTVSEVKEIDTENHRSRPMHMVMINKQNSRKSEMRINQINLRPDVPNDYFTVRYLERN